MVITDHRDRMVITVLVVLDRIDTITLNHPLLVQAMGGKCINREEEDQVGGLRLCMEGQGIQLVEGLDWLVASLVDSLDSRDGGKTESIKTFWKD